MELKQQVKNLREDLNIANVDSDRKSVALLTKVCLLLRFFKIIVYQCFSISIGDKAFTDMLP